MIRYDITPELEEQSKFGIPHSNSRIWFWKDNLNHIGSIRAITEMEALDRIAEVVSVRGTLKWITKEEYLTLIE